jgi:HlyD family secretion protein
MNDSKKKGPKPVFIVLAILIGLGLAAKLIFFKTEFYYAGTLEATKIDLSAQLPSTIQTVEVREGESIKKGQKLIALACEDIRIAHQLASENYERNLRLLKAGTASKEAYDQMKSRKLDADVRLGWCEISSPISGKVLSRYHEPSEWVNPGTKLLTLANIRDIWTYIYVPQPLVSRLKPGMKVIGRLPEFSNRTFLGDVLKINEEAEFTPKNVQTRSERQRLVFGVKVSFFGSNDDEILKPGMTIEIELPKEVQK